MARLVISRRVNETVIIGDNHIRITILSVSERFGKEYTRLRIEADPSIQVSYRKKDEDVIDWVGLDSENDKELKEEKQHEFKPIVVEKSVEENAVREMPEKKDNINNQQ